MEFLITGENSDEIAPLGRLVSPKTAQNPYTARPLVIGSALTRTGGRTGRTHRRLVKNTNRNAFWVFGVNLESITWN
jgi:hypothetical protein